MGRATLPTARSAHRLHRDVAGTLLTGATGFIGSHLARLLVQRGDELRVLVRKRSRRGVPTELEVEQVEGDVLDRRAVRRAMRGIERVFHVAGTTSLVQSRERVFALNVEGTRIVLEEALRAGVQDVARGHLLADERGRVGERYILGNRNFTLDRLFADLGRLSGVEPPAVKLPLSVALAMANAGHRLPLLSLPSPTEIRASSLNWAFRSTKARRELGWRPSPHEDALEETIAFYRARKGEHLASDGSRQPLALRATGAVLRRF